MEKITYTTLDAVRTGRRIKEVLKEKGYSVRKIQMMLNLSCPQPIYRWIKGKAMPSIDNLYMLHRILRVHMEDMLVAKDEANAEENSIREVKTEGQQKK